MPSDPANSPHKHSGPVSSTPGLQKPVAIMPPRSLLVQGIQLLVDKLGHLEHVDPVGLEDFSHRSIAEDVSLVGRVLKIIGFDVLPELLGHLRP
jgi:hypothetical protein